jgi:hypothetical protein
MTAIGVALIVGVFGFLGPYLLKRQDWKRQDDVAKRVAEAAVLLVESGKTTNTKLDEIHTLVNSNMTESMQAELAATVRELATLQEVVHLKESTGQSPSDDTRVAIQVAKGRIAELRAVLADRLAQNGTSEEAVKA